MATCGEVIRSVNVFMQKQGLHVQSNNKHLLGGPGLQSSLKSAFNRLSSPKQSRALVVETVHFVLQDLTSCPRNTRGNAKGLNGESPL